MTKEEQVETTLSILPFAGSDSELRQVQASYLAYRYTGYTVRQALAKIGVTESTLRSWRENNEEFNEYENMVLDKVKRQTLSKEVIQLRIIKNYMEVLDLDSKILEKANGLVLDENGEPEKLSTHERAYLSKLRGMYNTNLVETFNKLLQNPVINQQFNINNLIRQAEERNANTTETIIEQTEVSKQA